MNDDRLDFDRIVNGAAKGQRDLKREGRREEGERRGETRD
jgi:hypothetical protein